MLSQLKTPTPSTHAHLWPVHTPFPHPPASPLLPRSKSVSHLSHIGGLLGGLFVSFAFLPNLKDRRFQAMRRVVERTWGHRLPRAAPREHRSCWHVNKWLLGLCLAVCAVAVLYLYAALPMWIWLWKLPHLTCPPVQGLP